MPGEPTNELTVSVVTLYHVAVNGSVVGGMMDQFEPGEVSPPFPFRREQNRFTDPFAAEAAAEKMREHIKAVEALPSNKKQHRSAKLWRLKE